jgi:leucyl-tRNA synthetase
MHQPQPVQDRAPGVADPSAYTPAWVEDKWRRRWRESGLHKTPLDTPTRPFYNLMMFPYPSAEGLHIGNVYAFTGADIYGRYRRLKGDTVFEPMGYDAFGIHSENYALRIGEHPKRLIPRNIANFRRQLDRLGAMFDWDHEVNTTDPSYYGWTQWLFLRLYGAGLAEHREALVNWCPSCLTVLADEQVIAGACERCGTTVEQRTLKQWFLKTTRYAGALLDALEDLDWSEQTKIAQRNWIGRSEGALIDFGLVGCRQPAVTVFTTRPDTLYGATFLVVGADHPRLLEFAAPERLEAVRAWRESLPVGAVEPDVTTGMDLGSAAVHPLTGERLPVWSAPYVLGTYSSGVVMAVPAHDERDHGFARAHGLPVVEVVSGGDPQEQAWTAAGMLVGSGEFTGFDSQEGGRAIVTRLQALGRGRPAVQYRLRDWLISRQRYWGLPIPIIHCEADGPVPVPEEDLPLVLPEVEDFRPLGTGVSPLAALEEWVSVPCPRCGRAARRETDVSDSFLDSAWYFLRYPSTDLQDRAFDHDRTWTWLPVDSYIGGNEHAVLHLLYARFIMRALHAQGLVPTPEPFTRFRTHGIIVKDGAKMSKSRGNVVNPDEYLELYGADALRLYLMFMGPYTEGGDFREEGIVGVTRFLERTWRACQLATRDDPALADTARERRRHRLIAQVERRIDGLAYNTVIAMLMEFSRELSREASAANGRRVDALTLLQLLAPFAPHIADELWERAGQDGSIHDASWPDFDPELAAAIAVTIAVTVNGRRRASFEAPAGTPVTELEQQAVALPRITKLLAGREPTRIVSVPDRIVNIVV